MIEWGNIEVIVGDENMGVPINPINPFDESSDVSTQVKGRTGVQTGAKLVDLKDGNGNILKGFKGRWNGTTSTGATCEVRVWETAPPQGEV